MDKTSNSGTERGTRELNWKVRKTESFKTIENTSFILTKNTTKPRYQLIRSLKIAEYFMIINQIMMLL